MQFTNFIKTDLWVNIFLLFCDKTGSIHKIFLLYSEVWGLTWGWVVSWTFGFLHGIPFFLDRDCDTKTVVVQICVLYRHFLKNLISRKQITIFIAKDTIGNFKVKYVFENLCLNLGLKPGERNESLLQYSCLENPMDREAWQATVHGVTKGGT